VDVGPAISAFSAVQQACWSLTRPAAKRLISVELLAGVSPSWLICVHPGGDLAVEPATRTM
jgi:hypothetical protein